MHRFAKLLDQGVNGLTDKVISTVTNMKRDFSKRSKQRKQEKKDKKEKKLEQINNVDNVEHKYALVCNLPNCEFHPKPNAYEDFILNTLWSPKTNRTNLYNNQIMADDLKISNDSIEKENNKNKDNFIISDKKSNKFNDHHLRSTLSSDESSSSGGSSENLNNNNSVELTVTDENGQLVYHYY